MGRDSDMRRSIQGTRVSYSLTASSSTTPKIDHRYWAGGGFVVTGLGAASVTFYGAGATVDTNGIVIDDTYGQICDNTNSAVSQSLTNGNAYVLPDQCFPFAFIKIVCNASTATILYTPKS